MESIAFAVPILPGKTDEMRLIAGESMGKRKKEHAESRDRMGILREYSWVQKSPRGDMLIMYMEADDMKAATETFMNSQEPYDVWQRQQLHYVTGIDYGKADEGPSWPETLFEVYGETAAHAVPVAMLMPVIAGKSGELRAWFDELKGPRCDELRNYAERAGIAKEGWYLQEAPMGDMLIDYILVEDPEQSLRSFARSDHPFDAWFKEKLMELTGVDLGRTGRMPFAEMEMPELILDWHHSYQAAA